MDVTGFIAGKLGVRKPPNDGVIKGAAGATKGQNTQYFLIRQLLITTQ